MNKRTRILVPRTPLLDEAIAALAMLMSEMRLCDLLSDELFGVTAAQLRILSELTDHGGQTINELAAALAAHQSSISAQVAALLEVALVRVATDERDARAVQVWITPKGRAILRRANGSGRPLAAAALSRMPGKDVAALAKKVRSLASLMERIRQDLENVR